MDYYDPHFRSRRPIRIAVLGASGVGKTSITLQFVTNEVSVGTSPTTIEDNYRKEIRITVHDEEVINRIQRNITNEEDEEEILLEEAFGITQSVDETKKIAFADLSLSLKITDTAGYQSDPKGEGSSSRSLLSRLTLKKKPGPHHVQLQDRKKSEDSTQDYSERKNSNALKAKNRLENCMRECDGVVLVYSVLDEQSFVAACELRHKFVRLRTCSYRSADDAKQKHRTNYFNKFLLPCCKEESKPEERAPPIFLVGTHSDVRVEQMMQENSSRMYDINFLHLRGNKVEKRGGVKKRKLGKTFTTGRSSVYPHDVYPVISEWKECAGFAEITSTDTGLVKQIFEKLNLAIITPRD